MTATHTVASYVQAMAAPTTITLTRRQTEDLVRAAIMNGEQNANRWTAAAMSDHLALLADLRAQVPECFPGQDWVD